MFVTCQVHVLGPRGRQGAASSPTQAPLNFASIEYFDSLRSVIDVIDPNESSLVSAMSIVFSLVLDHGAEIADVDVRGPDDARFVLKFRVPDSVMAEPPQ